MPPTSYADVLEAGYHRDRDFRVVIGNREHVRHCLLVAPHGGGIEPMTSEIASAVAAVNNRAYYLFEGLLPRNNWNAFHIDSTSYDEPEFEALTPHTEVVVSFHGAERDRGRNIYVGGLHEEGRRIMVRGLNAALDQFGISAVDASQSAATQAIAGLHPRNLTNRGRAGRGIQLEFSEGARLVFFPGTSRAERQRPNGNLPVLAQAVDQVLRQLTNFQSSIAKSRWRTLRKLRADRAIAHGWWHGIRMPGTNIPGVLTAGTFYQDGRRVFWDDRTRG